MALLEVDNLHTYFRMRKGVLKAVDGVTYSMEQGRTLGIVGESGSGKSVTAMSILKLLDSNGYIAEGSIRFQETELTKLSQNQMNRIRGNLISMIFQEPMTSLNPVFTIAKQIMEPYQIHQGLSAKEAREKAVEMLTKVRIPNPEVIAGEYPHQLSGGMRQRIMIAMALACKPKILIADEPTTALDVTIQAQILKLMNELKQNMKTAILFITHDLGVIREMADEVVVMYCGQVMERVNAEVIFDEPKFQHPYTEGLLAAIPTLTTSRDEPLETIPGMVPNLWNLPKGCRFASRCRYATKQCTENAPELVSVDCGHWIRCFYPEVAIRRGSM